jgi:hypothetical protein
VILVLWLLDFAVLRRDVDPFRDPKRGQALHRKRDVYAFLQE